MLSVSNLFIIHIVFWSFPYHSFTVYILQQRYLLSRVNGQSDLQSFSAVLSPSLKFFFSFHSFHDICLGLVRHFDWVSFILTPWLRSRSLCLFTFYCVTYSQSTLVSPFHFTHFTQSSSDSPSFRLSIFLTHLHSSTHFPTHRQCITSHLFV